MPAAAVIPAPIAYINAVAVKKLVVGFRAAAGCQPTPILGCGFTDSANRISPYTEANPCGSPLNCVVDATPRTTRAYGASVDVTVNKTACSRQPDCRLNDLAWNNKGSATGPLFVGFQAHAWVIRGGFSRRAVAWNGRPRSRHQALHVRVPLLRDQEGRTGTYVLLG